MNDAMFFTHQEKRYKNNPYLCNRYGKVAVFYNVCFVSFVVGKLYADRRKKQQATVS